MPIFFDRKQTKTSFILHKFNDSNLYLPLSEKLIGTPHDEGENLLIFKFLHFLCVTLGKFHLSLSR